SPGLSVRQASCAIAVPANSTPASAQRIDSDRIETVLLPVLTPNGQVVMTIAETSRYCQAQDGGLCQVGRRSDHAQIGGRNGKRRAGRARFAEITRMSHGRAS